MFITTEEINKLQKIQIVTVTEYDLKTYQYERTIVLSDKFIESPLNTGMDIVLCGDICQVMDPYVRIYKLANHNLYIMDENEMGEEIEEIYTKIRELFNTQTL